MMCKKYIRQSQHLMIAARMHGMFPGRGDGFRQLDAAAPTAQISLVARRNGLGYRFPSARMAGVMDDCCEIPLCGRPGRAPSDFACPRFGVRPHSPVPECGNWLRCD